MSLLKHVDPAVGSAAGAILFTTLTQYYPAKRLELCSEIVCWAILPFIFKRFPSSDSHSTLSFEHTQESKKQNPSTISPWLVPVGIAAAAFYKAESNKVGFYPLLTPLLLAVHAYFTSHSTSFDPQIQTPLINTVWGAALTAIPAVLSLSNGDLFGSLISIILVVSLLVVYSILIPGPKLRLLSVDIATCIEDISFRTACLLVFSVFTQLLILGPPTSDIVTILLSGSLKAASWFFTIQTATQMSWSIAPTVGTFVLACARDPSSQSSQLQAISHVLVSTVSLAQVTQFLPKQAKGKSVIWLFLSLSILPFVFNEYMIYETQNAAINTFSHGRQHPVEILAGRSMEKFESTMRNQSGTYEAAALEYKRRYRLDPPTGFEGWFQFAQHHKSPIIDDFDMITDSISPFLKLSGKEVAEAMDKLYKTSGNEVWLCEFLGRTSTMKCKHKSRVYDRHYSFLFNRLLYNLPGVLPNVKLLINHFDEPRLMNHSPKGDQKKEINLTDMSQRPTWDTLTRRCLTSQARSGGATKNAGAFGLPFVEDHLAESDLCRHPEYQRLHGAFISPKTFPLIEGLVPVLSTGAYSTMGDVLFPSPAYIEKEFQYDSDRDMQWSEKNNNLYWRGSTTGGYAQDGRWRDYQRQRFVSMTQNLGHQKQSYLRKEGDSISTVKSRFLNGRLFDVGFTRIFQCDRKFCRDQSTYFDVKSWADKDKAFSSRLAFDLDGNGISGRYYKLLASNSLPLKQALLREWHDERLMPWVHYIPVSQSLEELPELVTYLTSIEKGQRLAEDIANRGKKWMGKAVREVDMAIYLYRLILELARLQDPEREAFQVTI
ncbi:hypothetical protein FVEN_g6820 [Fusarium venenatum]|uniref:Glycosyl transferase CAP10 domain-containing protein n=1 Tax=Fusarium venenatum TaxID=56646 RepID=A0A2L2T2I4_9HYPO|nr:uncharacterized protein FVRRES_00211 [Fusarium venenatum]KAG8355229.1 hypothetical protein FVEN_g6820 [Fusarium venenatum]CEI63699.1 unnamed protein product [Fusarium venenatum]